MAGSCNRAPLYRAAHEQGRADAGVHLAELPADCTRAFSTLERKVGDNPVVLLKLYEDVVLPDASRTLIRCSGIYLNQKRELEAR